VSILHGFVSGEYEQIKEVQRLIFINEAVNIYRDNKDIHKFNHNLKLIEDRMWK